MFEIFFFSGYNCCIWQNLHANVPTLWESHVIIEDSFKEKES